MFPERFSNLPAYAFPRLRALLDVHEPGGEVMHMTIGEPKHAFPAWVGDVIAENVEGFGKYPANDGTPELLGAIRDWVQRRYGVGLDENQIMALNGTREGLYNACMALVPEQKGGGQPVILLPNPFYQVYMIGAISVGAEPMMVPATAETGHLPDYTSLPPEVLNRVAAAYICSPANPQGAVASRDYWVQLIKLAEQYDFRIFADECYSEIYRNTPPVGALQVAQEVGADPERVVIFHSLSKRSNLPGLRSGFVAGGPDSIQRIRQLRAYSGAPLPLPLQAAAAKVWADEAHVVENRTLYQQKFDIADRILGDLPGYLSPEAGFFLWLPVEDGEEAALKLWKETGVRVLPGAYLARDVNGFNPGKGYIRVALVHPNNDVERALTALRHTLYQ
ncbi:aminotransferase class I/II-fold pyridoxal phosphate-dependent enzyme [Thalassovita mediterranea]|jgi:aspartate/methionine/tyrosine aminotransferase|uniref:LL-diaminopimelate aminotransferase n=1 Tax=Thalassovita mediterranea TaxID=340021 RepID=A0A0P1H4W2_9RHOB|nr:aminotransferase class I/II-fold pyridoxal phosphate-dependent enzyme [Thalassovita mediterranea]CUH85137.1 LL-diaminopimelate aminotransferase [Thalassovita mediterranea]SIS30909.1 Aspartate/methionine/tyrosine aminotransferase [Thalassovita mediterranea]